MIVWVALVLGGLGFGFGLTAFLWACGQEAASTASIRRLEQAFGFGYHAGRRDGQMWRGGP